MAGHIQAYFRRVMVLSSLTSARIAPLLRCLGGGPPLTPPSEAPRYLPCLRASSAAASITALVRALVPPAAAPLHMHAADTRGKEFMPYNSAGASTCLHACVQTVLSQLLPLLDTVSSCSLSSTSACQAVQKSSGGHLLAWGPPTHHVSRVKVWLAAKQTACTQLM